MKALIIAAGEGKRLKEFSKDEPKPLINLLGLSLIERVILTTKQAGVDEFIIVIGYRGDKIKSKIGTGEKYNVKIDYVQNNEWQKGNGISVLKAKKFLKDNFVLLMADHIFDVRILRELLKQDLKKSVSLAIDRSKPILGDTKVLVKEGLIISIGKKIKKSNCIDTGIFFCSPKIFSYLEKTAKKGKTELADCIAEAARYKDAQIFDITGIDSYESKMRKEIAPW